MSNTPQSRRYRLLAWSCAVAIGVLGTWLLHRHQFASNFDLFPAPREDSRLTAYLCEHWYRSLQGKAELLSPSVFYPAKGTLAYTDLLLLFVPPYALLREMGLDIFTALAITTIVFNFLNFMAGFALLFHAARFSLLPSVAGAMFFAFNNPKLSNPDLLQLQPVFLLAIAGMCVVVFVRDAPLLGPKQAFGLLALAGLAVDVQLLTGFYLGWFLVFWSGLFLAIAAFDSQARSRLTTVVRRHRRPVLGAAGLTITGLVPFLLIYLPAVHEVRGWEYSEALRGMPVVRSYLLMADGNLVWSGVSEAMLQAFRNAPLLERTRHVSIGLIPSLTWVGLSFFAVMRRRQHPLLAAATLAVNLLILLTLQYHGHSLWHTVYQFVPAGNAIRAVYRFMIVATLPMSMAFAFAVEWACQRIGQRTALKAALVTLVTFGVFEQFNSGEGQYFSISAENQRLQALAARLPAHCDAFYLTSRSPRQQPLAPYQYQNWMHDAMFVSLLRGVPTLDGRSSKTPPHWHLRRFLEPGYEQKVQLWINLHQLKGRICQLQIDQ